MNKTVILTFVKNQIIFDNEINKYAEIVPIFSNNIFVRIFRRFFRKLNMNLPGVFYNKKIKNLDCNTIIIFESCLRKQYFDYIKKHNENKRIILWYWNPVATTISPKIIPDGIEKWSYSKADCAKYGLNYNTQFYFNEFVKSSSSAQYDLLYVGADKGRKDWLDNFNSECQKRGLKTIFNISSSYSAKSKQSKKYQSGLSYKAIIDLIIESRAILDYYSDNTAGISLRPLEALFFNKKLITNNITMKSYDFYCKENIFILGEDSDNDIVSFLKSPVKPVDANIVQKYDFVNWLERF